MKEKVSFKNSRDLNLVGDFYKSDSEEGIIICHGFTGDRHFKGRFDKTAEELNKEGFNVLSFDFSGCGESDDDSINVKKQIDDLKSAIDFIKGKDIKKIGLIGHSLGGLIAIKVCSIVDSIVLWAPVTNKKNNYKDKLLSDERIVEEKGNFIKIKKEDEIRKKIIIDKQMINDRENVNQEELLSKINFPVLIIQGTNDESIPLSDSENAIKYLLENSRLEIVKGADHIFSQDINKVIDLTIEWFKNNLNNEKQTPDEIKALKEKLEKTEKLAEERLNQIKYLQADIDNLRKRYEKEKQDIIRTANEALIKELLVVLDSFDAAIKINKGGKNKEGLLMLEKKFFNILVNHGLKEIEAMGKQFDPNFHDVLCKEFSRHNEEEIIEEIQKGYTFGSKVIRASKVKVSKGLKIEKVKEIINGEK